MSQFVHWWHENPDKADEIRANRRKKLKDPAAAEAHRQRCREYYARTKQPSDRTRGLNRPKSFWINGLPVEYWGVGQVCQLLQLSTSTLRNWEEREIIPVDAKIVDAMRRRWWPAVFVQQKLGAGSCPAMDLSAACAGFIFIGGPFSASSHNWR